VGFCHRPQFVFIRSGARLRFRSATVLLLLCSVAVAVLVSGTRARASSHSRPVQRTLMQMQSVFNDSLYEQTIVEIPKPGSLPTRRLQIYCLNDCAARIRFQEDFVDTPLSMFRLWDGSNKLITIWTSGSAYWVRVYLIDSEGVQKILDQATRSAPQFGVDSRTGSPVVILDNPESEASPIDYKIHGTAWEWNGKQYQAMK